MPKVIHCNGKREDTETSRYIGRPTVFGNPFPLRREEDRRIVLQRYTEYFYQRIAEDEGFRVKVLELRGYDLACWCAPRLCHGDVILDWLESRGNDRIRNV